MDRVHAWVWKIGGMLTSRGMVDEGLLQFIEHIRDHGPMGREC